MAILREWRCELRRELGIHALELQQLFLHRQAAAIAAEVITLSWWPSMDAIRGFAGDDVERAVYYPQDDRYLLTKPEKVQHYQSHGAFDPPAPG